MFHNHYTISLLCSLIVTAAWESKQRRQRSVAVLLGNNRFIRGLLPLQTMKCTHCADIDLNNSHNGYRYALLDSQKMSKSSEAGCEGCSRFLSMAEIHFGKPLGESDPTPPGLHVQLRRYGAEDSRVDLEFLESKGAPKLRGSVGLRLCSAYGKITCEPLLYGC
jgi:hypothetical protein